MTRAWFQSRALSARECEPFVSLPPMERSRCATPRTPGSMRSSMDCQPATPSSLIIAGRARRCRAAPQAACTVLLNRSLLHPARDHLTRPPNLSRTVRPLFCPWRESNASPRAVDALPPRVRSNLTVPADRPLRSPLLVELWRSKIVVADGGDLLRVAPRRSQDGQLAVQGAAFVFLVHRHLERQPLGRRQAHRAQLAVVVEQRHDTAAAPTVPCRCFDEVAVRVARALDLPDRIVDARAPGAEPVGARDDHARREDRFRAGELRPPAIVRYRETRVVGL